MNSRIREQIACLLRLTIVGAFLLQAVLPQHFAFALLSDCGPHTYNPCDEHENTHMILTHEDGSAWSLDDDHSHPESDSSSHDSSHQVENSLPYIALTTATGTEVDLTCHVVSVSSNDLLPVRYRDKLYLSSTDPPDKDFNLLSLRSIRLQV